MKPARSYAKEFEIIIDWSAEDGLYVVRVPDLPGCTCHGETREEAARNAQEAIEFYVACLEEDGKPLPQPRTRLALAQP